MSKPIGLWFVNICISLSLLAAAVIILTLYDEVPKLAQLLAGGSLFFFATTLSASHFVRYFLNFHIHTAWAIGYISLGGFVIVGVSFVLYTIIVLGQIGMLTETLPPHKIVSFSKYTAFSAVVYSFLLTLYMAKRKRDAGETWN